MGTKRAFTLIEVLLVVAIIALLISMLMPSLGLSREQAKLLECQASQRDVMMGSLKYTFDNTRQLPFNNWRSNEVPQGNTVATGWLYDFKVKDPMAFGGSASPQTVADHIKTGALWDYILSAKAYRCPNSTPPDPFTGAEPVLQMTNYTMNGSTNNYGRLGDRSFALASFKPDAIIYWEPDYSFWWDGSDHPGQGLAPLHFDGGVVMNVDQSAEFMTIDEFDIEELSRPGRLHNVPGQR